MQEKKYTQNQKNWIVEIMNLTEKRFDSVKTMQLLKNKDDSLSQLCLIFVLIKLIRVNSNKSHHNFKTIPSILIPRVFIRRKSFETLGFNENLSQKNSISIIRFFEKYL